MTSATDPFPRAVRELLTANLPATFAIDGQRDAAIAEGRFPVVLFSHGYSGFRQQSSFLTAHLASQGMIVVAPDHAGRDLFHVLSGLDSADSAADVDELLGALDLVAGDGRFRDHVDAERVAAIGHSAGGGTVQRAAAADSRLDGVVVMAAGALGTDVAGRAVPSFFITGGLDGVVSAATDTRPAFERAVTPAWYWELERVGHNGFSDLCTIGGGTGIIGLAEASGLGPVLDAQPQLRTLGEDGCVPPAVPVDTTFPPIRHAVTAWLRWVFGDDPEPLGLAAELARGRWRSPPCSGPAADRLSRGRGGRTRPRSTGGPGRRS